MLKVLLSILITTSLSYAADECISKDETKILFSKKYPFNVLIESEFYTNHCGYTKRTMNIYQNNKKVHSLRGTYGIDILSDKDMNNDGTLDIVISAKNAGYGMDEHIIVTIDTKIDITTLDTGFKIEIKKANLNLNIIEAYSLYFCIAGGDFCSHGSQLSIKIPLKFKNKKLKLDTQSMQTIKEKLQAPCKVDVSLDDVLNFSNYLCAKNNLLLVAHDIYLGDLKSLEKDLSNFNFMSKNAKDKLIQNISKSKYPRIDKEALVTVKRFLKAY